MDPLRNIRNLIRDDNLKSAFEELESLSIEKAIRDEILLQETRLRRIEKANRLGTISDSDYRVERNKICDSLLEQIREIEQEGGKPKPSHNLSEEAKIILFEAAHDVNARIKVISTKDGWSIQSNNKVLFKGGTPRERILWQDTIDQLCKKKLIKKIEPSQKISTTYELTQMGYKVVDSIPDVYSSQNEKFGSFADSRDGQIYKTFVFNDQVWLAQNLNFDAEEGCCFYNNDPKNREKFGRLYTWEAAHKACPPGWQLPTRRDWDILVDNFGGSKEAYNALMDNGVSGFNGLLGGYCDHEGAFESIENWGGYWTGTEGKADRDKAFFFYFRRDQIVSWHLNSKLFRYSVRCLKMKD